MLLKVLGHVRIVAGGRDFVPSRARTRGLLGLLALNAGSRLSPDAIAESLWRGTEPASSRSQIQTAIYGIRRVLNEAGASMQIDGGTSGYRLIPGTDEIDLVEFERLVTAGQAARDANSPEIAIDHFRTALDLWEGTPLADASGSFVEAARAMLIDRRLGAVEELADIELTRGADAALVPELAQHIATYPLRESLRSRYVLALHYGGRTSEALQNLREYRDLLIEKYGLDPGSRLAELEQSILRGDVPPIIGDHQRRSVADSATAPAQLPVALTDFVGRTDEMARLDRAAQRPGAIVAITGTPCVGKTALAIYWAHQVREQYPDGQLYVNLRGYSSAPPLGVYEVLSYFLTSFGLPPQDLPPDVDSAAALFRSIVADRQVLIVLDNARGPEHVRPLLAGGAGCLTIVTSRDQLAGLIVHDGARPIDVGPLSVEEAERLLGDILGHYRVEAEREAAAELGELCVRLPLALRIAAARLAGEPRVSIASTVTRLRENPLDELAVPGDPQTAVVSTFNLSYEHLPPEARRLFRLIGVIPCTSITVSAAAELIDADRSAAGSLLSGLAAASLLERCDNSRYAMHDLLRVYAAERSNQEDEPEVRAEALERIYEHWLAHLDAAARQLYPHIQRLPDAPAGKVDWTAAEAIEWIDCELPSLRRVTENLLSTDPRRTALIADALRGYFALGRGTVYWSAIAGYGLRAAVAQGDTRAEIMSTLSVAEERVFRGDPDSAAALLEHALGRAETIDWLEAQESLLDSLGHAYIAAGRAADAWTTAHRALQIAHRRGDPDSSGAPER